MRVLFICSCFISSFLLWTCQDIEDAPTSSRKTFIKLYPGPYDITASSVEIVTDGYVVVGTMSVPPDGSAVDSIVTVVFKTDKNGSQTGDFHYYQGGSGKSIKQLASGGYIIVGDRIKRDLNPPNVANGTIASARILLLSETLDSLSTYTKSDESGNEIKADFYGGSVTVDEMSGEIFALGTFVAGVGTQINEPEKPFIISLTQTGNTLGLNWLQTYDLIDRNYKNSKSIHVKDGELIWTSAIARVQGDITFSYVNIPVVATNSTFLNSSTFGETSDVLFSPRDIQPFKSDGFGYGVVGSYSASTDGSQSNMFFLKTDVSGNIDETSVRFFDAVASKENVAVVGSESIVIDEGETLTSTSDGGFVLAGSTETQDLTRDIFLVKVDAFGNIVWNKVIGGAGDEVVSSIRETADGELLICGTNNLANAAVVFLIKTDKNGELKN